MNGHLLMQGLVVVYVIVAVVFAWEGNWPKCLYWIGASIITSSVLVMK
jgi:drug/metabolite transporter (DMT)-like permease